MHKFYFFIQIFAYKYNFTSNHSFGSNCENDDCDGSLNNLKQFLFNDAFINDTNSVDNENDNPIQLNTPADKSNNLLNLNSKAYVTGWVKKKK